MESTEYPEGKQRMTLDYNNTEPCSMALVLKIVEVLYNCDSAGHIGVRLSRCRYWIVAWHMSVA